MSAHVHRETEILLVILAELVALQRQWKEIAARHGLALVRQGSHDMVFTLRELESVLERIAEAEERRLLASSDLAAALGYPSWEAPPRISEMALRLPDADQRLVLQRVQELKSLLEECAREAKRNQGLAEVGQKVAETTIRAFTQLAVRKSRSPAAYARNGQRTTTMAVPVVHRAWRG